MSLILLVLSLACCAVIGEAAESAVKANEKGGTPAASEKSGPSATQADSGPAKKQGVHESGAYTDPAMGMEFVFVKGGCFQMGDTFEDGYGSEKPVHEVCVDDFYIGKFEVTQVQWNNAMGTSPSGFNACGETCPVDTVTWFDAQDFVRTVNQRTGKAYRLPTEAEWEYAARSGGKSELFAGGDDADGVAWYNGNSENHTHPAGQRKPNGLGIHDMSGNVWEWVADWYNETYYVESPRENPQGPKTGRFRTLRGGCCSSLAGAIRASGRNGSEPTGRTNRYGFRLSRSAS